MSNSQQSASQHRVMDSSEPESSPSSTTDISTLQQATVMIKAYEIALSLPKAITRYICTILATLFAIEYDVDDLNATVAAAVILACRRHKTRRFLSEVLDYLSAPMAGTLMVLWDLEHIDMSSRSVCKGRELSVSCEESSDPEAFVLAKEGSMSKVAVTLTWSDGTQVLLHGKYNSMSNSLRQLQIRALMRPTPVIMTTAEVEGMYKEAPKDIESSDDEADEWEEIFPKRGMGVAVNGKALVRDDGVMEQLVDYLRDGLAVGKEFVGKMVNGDTSMIKGDTSSIP